MFGKKKEKKQGGQERDISSASVPDGFFREVDIEFLIHELKDPISVIETGIRTLLERSEKYGPLTAKQERTLRRTLRNSKKAREMLGHLLEIGRSQSGCFLPCRFQPATAVYRALSDSLETMAWQVYEQFCRFEVQQEALEFLSRNGVTFQVGSDARQCVMVQDEVKFCQIVGNLIKNGLHHRRERLDITIGREGADLLVEVKDDGPGIEKEQQGAVFQRYSRLKECALMPRDGHGIGLAGAQILARCMGGDIELDSERGRGTTFRLVLPMTMNRQT